MQDFGIKERVQKIKADIPAVYIVFKSKETPLIAKIMAVITLGYALSPIDLIPDFIPVLGYLDDILILPILVILTVKLIPKDVWEKSKKEAEGIWTDGKPKKWFCAIPIVIIWVLVVFIIVKAIWF